MWIELLVFFLALFLLLSLFRKREVSQVEKMFNSWDRIAEKLHEEEKRHVSVYLVYDQECVEFRTHSETMFARVSVHGSEGYPHKAVVTSPKPLSEIARLIFEQELSALIIVDFHEGT